MPKDPWIMQFYGPGGRPIYLLSYDFDAEPAGLILGTEDPKEAKQFESFAAVLEAWKSQSTKWPLRPDGLPNRPLSAFTATPIRLIDAVPGPRPTRAN